MAENISSISYTNKDFQTIYPELLELATRISERWTPDQTNESDPGIVLLKLAAICADKNNYNIDKNILECFPSSVTQMPNAREVFSQRGYYMHWYRSADGTISVSASPGAFTDDIQFADRIVSVTGNDDKIVYTILPSSVQRIIPKDGSAVSFDVIQGVAMQYKTTGGDDVVTMQDIDSENRIYFPNTSVAENGIFICNKNEQNYSHWVRVNDVDAEPLESTVYQYEFGVSRDGQNCYLQFADNIVSVIGDGIQIWYVSTDGARGNVQQSYLSKLANDTNYKLKNSSGDDATKLDATKITITQSTAATGGKDPETIEEAYRGYSKTVGTFDTLVTLRDYNNAMAHSKMVSNGFVADRTNDIQRAYQVITDQDGLSGMDYVTEANTLNAFNLTVYAFQNVTGVIGGAQQYNQTFTMLKNYDGHIDQNIINLKSYFEKNNKSIQHDFTPWETSRPLCIKNKYAVNASIIPQYVVTQLQANEIKTNIVNALYAGLNASSVDFGVEVTYDKVYDIIKSADTRIKSVSLANIEYTPYVSVCNDGVVTDIPLKSLANYTAPKESDTIDPYKTEIEIFAKSVLAGVTPLFYQDKNIEYSLAQDNVKELSPRTVTTETKISVNSTGTVLLDGESVVFYAPSMIDDTVYSLGVKYVAGKIGIDREEKTTYPANATSKANIVMLWKKDDKYYAHKYENTYIVPSQTIIANQSTYNTIAGSITGSGVDVDVSGVTEITDMWGAIDTLGTNDTITVKKKNEQPADITNYYTWVLNNTITDAAGNRYWELFEKVDGDANAADSSDTQSRVLLPGEYLIMSDSQKQNMLIIGAGAKITRTYNKQTGATSLRIPSLENLAEIASQEGIGYIPSESLVSGVSLTIQEREFILAGAGTVIKSTTTVTITNDEKDVNSFGVTIDDIALPVRDNDIGWTVRSFLAFDTMDGATKLSDPRQTITFDDAIPPSATGDSTNPVYIQTSPQYNLIGGKNLSLQYYSGYDQTNLLQPDVVIYSLKDISGKISDTETVNATLDNNGSVSMPSGTYTVILQPAEYDRVFKVTKRSGVSFTIFKIGDNNEKKELLPLKADGESHEKTTLYYLVEKSTSASTIRITITVGGGTATISALHKVASYPSDVLNESAVSVVRDKVVALDVNDNFDYFYDVPDEKKIPDPLIGYSFNNYDHPYNQFTICQMNTSDSKISIMNKLSAR